MVVVLIYSLDQPGVGVFLKYNNSKFKIGKTTQISHINAKSNKRGLFVITILQNL